MWVGIGVGIGRNRFAQDSGIFAAYAARVAADGGVTEAGACVDAVSGISLNSSLLLIPSGYKSGVVYSEIPTNGDGDLTFTRASSATRVNSDGLIESPRTNLVTYSNEFDNAAWTILTESTSTMSITPNYATAQNGLSASRLVATRPSTSFLSIIANFVSNLNTATKSVWIKNNNSGSVNINISDQAITVTDTWQRYEITNNYPHATIGLRYASADLSCDISIAGFQFELGNIATDYIPTTTSVRTTFAGITQDGTSASNVPRLDYSQGSCPALLLEPQRTNVVLNSNNAFTDGTNGSSATTTTPSVIDGVNYRKMTATAVDGNIFASVGQLSSTPTGLMCFSVFLKKGSCDDVQLIDQNTTGKSIRVNLSNGAIISQSSGLICGVESYGNDVYRVYIVQDFTSIGFRYDLFAKEIGDFYYTTAQMESGSYPTSVIITNGSSATRVADECTKTGIGALIGGTSGTVFFDIKTKPVLSSAFYKQFCYYFDSASAQSYMYLGSTNLITTNSNWGSLSGATPLVANTRYKIALVYAPNDFALYVNGVSVATASSGTPKDNDRVSIGQLGGGENAEFVFNQYTHFPSRLTNAELSALTTI